MARGGFPAAAALDALVALAPLALAPADAPTALGFFTADDALGANLLSLARVAAVDVDVGGRVEELEEVGGGRVGFFSTTTGRVVATGDLDGVARARARGDEDAVVDDGRGGLRAV